MVRQKCSGIRRSYLELPYCKFLLAVQKTLSYGLIYKVLSEDEYSFLLPDNFLLYMP